MKQLYRVAHSVLAPHDLIQSCIILPHNYSIPSHHVTDTHTTHTHTHSLTRTHTCMHAHTCTRTCTRTHTYKELPVYIACLVLRGSHYVFILDLQLLTHTHNFQLGSITFVRSVYSQARGKAIVHCPFHSRL